MSPKRTFTTHSGTVGGQLAERHRRVGIVVFKSFAKGGYTRLIEGFCSSILSTNRPIRDVYSLLECVTWPDDVVERV